MADIADLCGISSCLDCKPNFEEILESNEESQLNNEIPYKEPTEGNSQFYGMESYFNEEVVFYKDVRIYGEIKTNFNFLNNKSINAKSLNVLNTSIFNSYAYFGSNVYVSEGVNAGIVTARKELHVGCGGTTLYVTTRGYNDYTNPIPESPNPDPDDNWGRVGIGSTLPERKLDVIGDIKLSHDIYDSKNVPGKNGFFMVRDAGGIRWIPQVAEARTDIGIGTVGIATYITQSDGIFILGEGTPLYP